jgi:hypothetical protein
MADRSVLGPADVTDDELTEIVAGWIGADVGPVALVSATAEVVPYDLDAITTAGRYWLRGKVRHAGGVTDFSFFIKHVQSWARSPQFAAIPPHLVEVAEAGVPWRTEPLIYRSDLASRLPPGLTMARVAAIRDLDEKSAAVWLEEVPVVPRVWTVDQLSEAAYLLGRLAARPAVQELAGIGNFADGHPVRAYLDGRLSHQVLPILRSDDIWRHPLVAMTFDAELRERLLAAADLVGKYVDELEQLPTGAAHGDACTNNLLVRPDGTLVLIDFGFWAPEPLGFDLSQLVLGDVQLGRTPADELPAIDRACTAGYVEGLRAEGCDVDAAVIRRAHALLMLIFSGLSSIPFEFLGGPPTEEVRRLAANRATAARYILDLVDDTA